MAGRGEMSLHVELLSVFTGVREQFDESLVLWHVIQRLADLLPHVDYVMLPFSLAMVARDEPV